MQKAPAATLSILVEALEKMLNKKCATRIIGTRHGEKLYETLLTREEMIRAEDLGAYFRVKADNRDLNYNLFVSEGTSVSQEVSDYHSHNTKRLDVTEMIELLRTVPEVTEAMLTLKTADVGTRGERKSS